MINVSPEVNKKRRQTMTVRDAIHIFQISQQNLHRKRTTESYRYLLEHLENHFPDSHVEAITPDHIHQFLEVLTEHAAKSTRRLRYAQVKAFFNFLINEKTIP
jgi:site-specific recombinase XerD